LSRRGGGIMGHTILHLRYFHKFLSKDVESLFRFLFRDVESLFRYINQALSTFSIMNRF